MTGANTTQQLESVQLLTAEEVAELLAVSPRSVWRLSDTGQIPAPVRFGGRVTRWRLIDIRNFIAARAGKGAD